VNNFDKAVLVRGGKVEEVVPVTARGREVLWRNPLYFF